MIVCPSCQHENDPTRIFCQDCGIRLPKADESQGAPDVSPSPEKAPPQPAAPKQTRETKPDIRIKREKAPSSFSMGAVIGGLVRTLILAAIAAALIQALRAPSHIPEPVSRNEDLARRIQTIVSDVANGSVPRVVNVTPTNVNTVLAASIVPGESGGIVKDLVKFKRVFVRFRDGGLDLVKEQAYGSLPVYFGIEYQYTGTGSQMEVVGGFIGRLPVHPVIAKRMDSLFDVVFEGFSTQLNELKRVRSIRITPETATLDFPGKQ